MQRKTLVDLGIALDDLMRSLEKQRELNKKANPVGMVYDIGAALSIYWPYVHPCHKKQDQWIVLTQEGTVSIHEKQPRDKMIPLGLIPGMEGR